MNLTCALKKHFGYDAFRPLQEEIVFDALTGRDVFALMPTGGGKSLCFQLPALLRQGLTIVVFPLISLMKDQVDALQASGIATTFLNSALDGTHARSRLRGLYEGEFRLLYVAPERLMLESFIEKVKEWKIAIDEAQCISERATISARNIASGSNCRRSHTMLVLGNRDMEPNAVSVRVHGQGNLGAKPRAETIADIVAAIRERRS
jgi:DEAD/DEAH box helicase